MNTHSNPTQCERLKTHLERYGSLTPLEALDLYGCFRLGARIWELKKQGMLIDTQRFKTSGGAVVAKYVYRQPVQLGWFDVQEARASHIQP